MTDGGSTRRQVLAGIGTAVAAGVAGCGTDAATETGTAGAESPDPEPPRSETPVPTTAGTPIHPGYETATVRVETPGGEFLGAVTAAIADTPALRYTGLSETESLPEDRGMLFVYDTVSDRTYVMRGMAFGLDIVYADDGGIITTIHHAPAPGPTEDGANQRYPGRGRYVLEVNEGWTTDRGVTAGDRLVVD